MRLRWKLGAQIQHYDAPNCHSVITGYFLFLKCTRRGAQFLYTRQYHQLKSQHTSAVWEIMGWWLWLVGAQPLLMYGCPTGSGEWASRTQGWRGTHVLGGCCCKERNVVATSQRESRREITTVWRFSLGSLNYFCILLRGCLTSGSPLPLCPVPKAKPSCLNTTSGPGTRKCGNAYWWDGHLNLCMERAAAQP